MIYLSAPFARILLELNITPTEVWTCIHGDIVNRGQEVDCQPITYLICVALTKEAVNNKLPLAILQPTVPLADRNVLHHCHHMLTQHLPGLDPALQRVHGYLIATHIGEIAVELWQDR